MGGGQLQWMMQSKSRTGTEGSRKTFHQLGFSPMAELNHAVLVKPKGFLCLTRFKVRNGKFFYSKQIYLGKKKYSMTNLIFQRR